MLSGTSLACIGAMVFSVAAAGVLQADSKPERSLEERLMRPDFHREQPIQLREFEGGSKFEMKPFAGEKSFATRSYSGGEKVDTPRFLGIPIPWMAKKTVPVSDFVGKDTTFATKAFQASNASSLANMKFAAAGRSAIPEARAVPVRKANAEGSTQGYHNEMKENLQKDMSVEQVRELLNKPQ